MMHYKFFSKFLLLVHFLLFGGVCCCICWGWKSLFPALAPRKPAERSNKKVALVTGATGRTGQLCTKLLIDQGYDIHIFARDTDKAKNQLQQLLNDGEDNNKVCDNNIIEFTQGDLGNATAIQRAFNKNPKSKKITHIVYCAGGEDADYDAVSYRGVKECAKQAADSSNNVETMVVISTAWSSRPYSIASLLFNSLYNKDIPMACYYMGEQEVRKMASSKKSKSNFNYVILRPGGLNTDENYQKKYPDAACDLRLTYEQGDNFEFLGKAGRPGMCRTQLANAVVTALEARGQYTVEITGSGTVDMTDSSIYETTLVEDDNDNCNNKAATMMSNEDNIMRVHSQAVVEMKNTAIAASAMGITLIVGFGWIQGIISVLAIDAFIIFIWSQFFANRQII